MHDQDTPLSADLLEAVSQYAQQRLRLRPIPLDHPRSLADLEAAVGATVTPDGIGGQRALELFAEVLAPACLSVDHPRYLSFIPCAPTAAAAMFDLVVGASSIYAGSWMEGQGLSMPRIRRCDGWLTWRAFRPAPVGCSCREAR